MDNLNKKHLYILSTLVLSKHKTYSNIIKGITIYVNKLKGNKTQAIATHTALLFYYGGNWIVCEVSFNGKVNNVFQCNKHTKYYITDLGLTSTAIKDNILKEYYKQDAKNIFTKVVATFFNYPIFKAMASVELPEKNIAFVLLNKIIDLLSDISTMTRRFIGLEVEYCTEANLRTLYKNNIKIPDKLQNLLVENNFKFNEVYPQNILETTEYRKLIYEQ
jgi:hypothetical protein